ncbi:anti-repressor protein [Planomicrobium soli]|uniref:Anti-repressor protein n=1 Tax=Planomicrobium soli TaxID=1176648 RepID=A0A2P8H7H3_9BACL|nr:anti-repressor protein [Planomicrobium soli]
MNERIAQLRATYTLARKNFEKKGVNNMNELQNIFNYQGNEVRTVRSGQDIFFVAKDVCNILEIGNSRQALSRLDEDEKDVISTDTIKGQQSMQAVNESGLYSLILGSRKPEAKQFKRWITHEVLPAIRKHGTYMTPDTIEKVLTDPDTIIQIATQLKEERLKLQQAELTIHQQKPKVLFADAVATSESSILVGQLAKLLVQNGIHVGQNRMFKWLRDNGYLGKKGTHYNEPTQYAMERGWFEVKERTINNPDGTVRITRTTKVTGKGQVYFINKFLSDAALLAQ